MAHIESDVMFMRRALQLAAKGWGRVSPNPMVGAVIMHNGRIIGEGFHRRFGEAHAEVNALASVKDCDRELLHQSTMYVTLEPCSHYGKTPPCADLIVHERLGRVVVGMTDPFPKVAGSGIARMRDAGIDVTVGVLEEECRRLNTIFITAHTKHRPFIMLKWAQDAAGNVAAIVDGSRQPLQISSDIGRIAVHRLRAGMDAIMVGTDTVNIDNPRLDTRLWPGRSPRPVTFDRHGRLDPQSHVACNPQSIIFRGDSPLKEDVASLYNEYGITSLLVEGGPRLLKSFIDLGLMDAIRVETAPEVLCRQGLKAPLICFLGNWQTH